MNTNAPANNTGNAPAAIKIVSPREYVKLKTGQDTYVPPAPPVVSSQTVIADVLHANGVATGPGAQSLASDILRGLARKNLYVFKSGHKREVA